MPIRLRHAPGFALLACLAAAPAARAELEEVASGAFVIAHALTLPGSPERVYDAMTGDISGWWDHSFSKAPHRFYIEPWPGGGFLEEFDADGNGVRHGVVTWAERGRRLRFEGPLGLAGRAITFVSTMDLEAKGDSTLLRFSGHCAGESLEPGFPKVVDGVWRHFLFEGLKPYVESGKDLAKARMTRPER